MRVMRSIRFGERVRLDLIAEGFNLFNRFNEAAAAPFFTAVNDFGQRAEQRPLSTVGRPPRMTRDSFSLALS